MKLIKHMEATFVTTVVLAAAIIALFDTLPEAHARSPAPASVDIASVVVVKARRMSDQEKRKSLIDEQQQMGQAASGNRHP